MGKKKLNGFVHENILRNEAQKEREREKQRERVREEAD